MNFKLDRDDEAIVNEAARLFRRTFPLTRFRQAPGAGDGWQEVYDAGWIQCRVSEPLGMGLPLYLVAAIAREAGRQLVIEPFVNNVVILAQLFSWAEDVSLRDELMNQLRVRPGFLVADGRRQNFFAAPGAARESWVFGATREMLPVVLEGTPERPQVVAVDNAVIQGRAESAGIEDVGLVDLGPASRRMSAALQTHPGWHEALVREAFVVHAAGLIGAAEEAIRQTVDYVTMRKQFGRVIGEFQSIQHGLADLQARVTVAWLGTLRAALSSSYLEALAAHLGASVAAVAAAKSMVQFHGGIGFTWDHVSHRFLKAASVGANRFGAVDTKAEELGQHIMRMTGEAKYVGSERI